MVRDPDGYVRPKDIDNRSTFWQRVQWRLEAFAWDWLYWAPMKALGPDRASNFGGWLFRKLGPLLSQHKTAMRNISMAFPDWSEEKVHRTALAAWESAGRTAGELPHLPKIHPYEGDRVEVVGAERLDAIRESGEGAVMISGHFANWEVMAAVICRRPVDCLVTYRMLNNPHIDRRINAVRQAYGIGVLAPKGLGTRELMRALGKGRAVALMNDSDFGLTASLWTQDVERAERLGGAIDTGTVFLNRADYLDPALCWTGCKSTGKGGSLSEIGYHNLTRPKSYHLKKVTQ